MEYICHCQRPSCTFKSARRETWSRHLHSEHDAGDSRKEMRQHLRIPTTPSSRRREPDYELPETPEQQLLADFPLVEVEGAALMPGARVYAKWPTDGNFYPGRILIRDGLGRYKVRFVDGVARDMPPPDCIPLSQIKPGSLLMVAVELDNGDEELQPAQVVETASSEDAKKWNAGMFTVSNNTTEQNETHLWEKLQIDREQAKAFIDRAVLNRGSQAITAENITSTRERRSRHSWIRTPVEPESEAEAEPAPRRTPKPKPRPQKRVAESPPPATTPAKQPSTDLPSPKRKSSANSAEKAKGKATASPASDKLFERLSFVLTSANRKPARPDGEQEDEMIPLNKKNVRAMIEERGGVVIGDFRPIVDSSTCFLVADTHYRTHKYLSALSRAIPCVSHLWIHDSTIKGERLNYKKYILPAGTSLETRDVVDWHSNCPTLLRGKTVCVYTEYKPVTQMMDFVQIWTPLVRCMGATVQNDPNNKKVKIDILVTDASCGKAVLDKLKKQAMIVSSEWLIQTVITGTLPEPTAHVKYRYDYIEPLVAPPVPQQSA